MFPEKASIFTELGKLCDKVAVYSLKIAGEAERTSNIWQRALNSPHSLFNLNKNEKIIENREKR